MQVEFNFKYFVLTITSGVGQVVAAAIALLPFMVSFTAGSIYTGIKAGWNLSTKHSD